MDSQIRYKEKSVIIHRDEHGFGLRVGGQNPVYVDHVHDNGAAWKAGVKKDDLIIKVNGTLVKSYNHQDVVHMIQNCSPFVNLTLHSPEISTDTYNVVSGSGLQTNEQNQTLILTNNNINNNNSLSNSGIIASSMKVHLHQRLHHQHAMTSNLNWLLAIGDDLFQDSLQQKPQAQQQVDTIPVTSSPHQPVGVSKLVVSGPSPLTTSQTSSTNSGGKTRLRNTRHQSNAGDNPFYYYKTVPEKVSDATSCNIVSPSLMNQDQGTSKSGASLSIVRSRSSSKMSTRSTSGKYKPRNLRSRLVEDLKSLTITNSQATPSSLSTSPSSSDLSDCDDLQDSNRIDCLMNSSTGTGSNIAISTSVNSANLLGTTQASQTSSIAKPKHTTRRLEIIRELVDTEKTHTERLKHLNDLLYKPIKAEGLVPLEQLKMVFSCHKTLFKIHRQIYKILSAAQQNTSECHQEPLVGKALVEIFDGELGRRLEKAASTFCACQSTNTELLNRFTRKDTKAGEFLAQVANQQMLGRLGIKDLLASCFQRLTKYPLLLDNLLKATPTPPAGIHTKSLSTGSIATSLASSISNSNSEALSTNESFESADHSDPTPLERSKTTLTTRMTTASNNSNDDTVTLCGPSTMAAPANAPLDDTYAFERYCISKALLQSRQILIHVNDAVKRAISHNKLREIWRKTDKNPSLPVIDIETQQMLHEGPLTLRLARRTFDVYVLLLTHYLVILTREGQDKYKLKYFTPDHKTSCPIFNIDEHLVTRDTATDENGFYLLCKRKDEPLIYEFASQSPAERGKWKEKIHMAQLYNYAAAPDDDNTLTRYRELITLATSSNTPNNIEHSPSAVTTANSITSSATFTTTTTTSTTATLPNEDCTLHVT